MILKIIMGFLVVLLSVLIAYTKWTYSYWKRKGFPYIEPFIPFGSVGNPFKRVDNFGIVLKKVYDEVKVRNLNHCGIYLLLSPIYFVTNLDYVKNILTKDFHHFVDRGVYFNEKSDPIGAHLFALGGVKWRTLRAKLTPTFTSGKIRMMFGTLVQCQDSLQEIVREKWTANEAIDIKEVLGCFTTNVIGSCAFGLDCDAFKDDTFRKYGKKIFEANKVRTLTLGFATNFPLIARAFGIRQITKDVGDFFAKVVRDTVEYREKNGVSRRDFMQLLIEMKSGEGSLTMDEVTAQSFIFFLAGFETSSTTMTFAMYEMAKNHTVQERARKEVLEVLERHGGNFTYESITEMKYMNQIIDETLRKYPPLPFITRECVKDYKIPNESIVIEKGTRVMVPIMGIHHDPEIYADPEKFDPERFNDENKRQRHQYAHIPFGEGPRICIGLRFGVLQTKVGLASMLKSYKWSVNSKTLEPLKLSAYSIVLAVNGDVWLNAEKL